MAVIGDRAYIATPLNNGRFFTNLRLFDVSDPTSPLEIASNEPSSSSVFKAPPAFWLGLPVDVVADEASPITGGPVVAVATTPLTYPYHASNVRLYDVSNEQQWRWIGAVSLGRDPSDGMIRRIEMKGEMLYVVTAGIGKGIQFVNLNEVRSAFDTALADGEQSAAYWQMQGKLNSTEGFAQEAIVQTVPVDTGTGANSQLWDLAVTDLAINGITQPAVVATGRSPLVIASQTDGLIYNGDITDGLGGAALTGWGYGVAAGTVAGTPIAIVSAVGVDGAPVSGPHVLAIVDLENPSAPRSLALLPLPGSAATVQDVVLRDTSVFIGTNSGTYLVSIAEPGSPRFVGTIPGVQGRLGFSSDSILIGTRRGLTEVTSPEGGVKTAALEGPLLLIPRIPPQLTREVPSLPGLGGDAEQIAGALEEFVEDVDIRILLIGGSASAGNFELFQNGALIARQAVGFAGNQTSVRIAKGTRVAGNSSLAVGADADTDSGLVVAERAKLPAGPIRVLTDNNNDLSIDPNDDEALIAGKLWTFWSSANAPNDVPKAVRAADLEDFGTIRVRRLLPTPQLRLVVRSDNPGADYDMRWSVGRKIRSQRATEATPLDYLTHETTAQAQARGLNWSCVPSNAGFPDGCGSNYMSRDEGFELRPELFERQHAELLFRCDYCPPGPNRRLAVEVWVKGGVWVEVASARVVIEPLQKLMTIVSAHQDGTRRPTPAVHQHAASSPIPGEAKTLTVLVHGYAVNEASAVNDSYPRMFRRLYWAGLPVIRARQNLNWVVGIAWPGDSGFPDQLFYVRDEFRAFQSSVPIAHFLAEQRARIGQAGRIDIIAHSLGNLAVNEALLALPAGTVSSYAMVESAVPMEAFTNIVRLGTDAQMTSGDLGTFSATSDGYAPPCPGEPGTCPAADQKWEASWLRILGDRNDGNVDLYEKWREKAGANLSEAELRTAYVRRWSGATVAGSNSPWRGRFAENVAKTAVTNYYATTDQVFAPRIAVNDLEGIWIQAQRLQKPHSFGILPIGFDDEFVQYWGRLDGTDSSELLLWDDGTEKDADQIRTTRRWAELAFWFSPVTFAAGYRPLTSDTQVPNIRMDAVAGNGGLDDGFSSHRYLTVAPSWRAFEFYRRFRLQ